MCIIACCVPTGSEELPSSCATSILWTTISGNTFTTCSDKGLGIDLVASRPMIWFTPGTELRDDVGCSQPDMVMWIDTSCMIADCLTQHAESWRLDACLRRCLLEPTDEIILCEMKKQQGSPSCCSLYHRNQCCGGVKDGIVLKCR